MDGSSPPELFWSADSPTAREKIIGIAINYEETPNDIIYWGTQTTDTTGVLWRKELTGPQTAQNLKVLNQKPLHVATFKHNAYYHYQRRIFGDLIHSFNTQQQSDNQVVNRASRGNIQDFTDFVIVHHSLQPGEPWSHDLCLITFGPALCVASLMAWCMVIGDWLHLILTLYTHVQALSNIYTHASHHIHVPPSTHIHTHTHARTHTHIHAHTHTHAHTHIHAHTHTHTHTHTCMHTHLILIPYIHAYKHAHLSNTHTHSHTSHHMPPSTHTHTHTHTHHTHTHTHTHRDSRV